MSEAGLDASQILSHIQVFAVSYTSDFCILHRLCVSLLTVHTGKWGLSSPSRDGTGTPAMAQGWGLGLREVPFGTGL